MPHRGNLFWDLPKKKISPRSSWDFFHRKIFTNLFKRSSEDLRKGFRKTSRRNYEEIKIFISNLVNIFNYFFRRTFWRFSEEKILWRFWILRNYEEISGDGFKIFLKSFTNFFCRSFVGSFKIFNFQKSLVYLVY